jgi:hypothetical protein
VRWHPRWGERVQELTVLVHEADPRDIEEALHAALLTNTELAAGEAAWRDYPDPFGCRHTDPCDTAKPDANALIHQENDA